MHIPKKYFHDRAVLLLLTLNSFLAVAGSLLLLLRLDNPNNVYLVQYRSNLGINDVEVGAAREIVAFAAFSLLVLVVHTLLSIRVYSIRRNFSVIVLAMASLLLTFSVVVGNALLALPGALPFLLGIILVFVTVFLTVVDRKH